MKLFLFIGSKKKLLKFLTYGTLTVCVLLVFFAALFTSTKFVSGASANGPYYHGNKENKNVSLMVNVYWGGEFIEPMLEVFKKHKATTTFFMGGTFATQNKELVQKIIDAGHELGNHGYYHKDHKKITDQRNREEISITHEVIQVNHNIDMKLFAPPSGSFNNKTLEIAKSLGYKTIMWTRDTIDWRDKNADLIFNRATKKLAGGDLVLMHPTQCTLDALDRILTAIASKGLKCVPVSQTIA